MKRIPESPYKSLLSIVSIVSVGAAIGLAVFYNFGFNIFGRVMFTGGYLYLLIALFLPLAFLIYRATKSKPVNRITWYDIPPTILSFLIPFYFFLASKQMIEKGWDFMPPMHGVILGGILWLLIIEACRRVEGWPLFIISIVVSVYPLFAGYVPGVFQGYQFSLPNLIGIYTMGSEGILGVAMKSFGELIIGYIIFGIALRVSGGGQFFIDVAFSLMGRFRGGTAKSAIFASALFSMISGSSLSNVLTIGPVTIPAMKRSGFNSTVAAAVETCASTGGAITPPVMGAAAFIMANFLGISYGTVCLVAAIPAVVYFLALFIQIDSYAANASLKGITEKEIPKLMSTLKTGWPYLLAVAVLLWGIFILRREAEAPYYATAFIFAYVLSSKAKRLGLTRIWGEFFVGSAKALVELTAILAVIGFMTGGLTMTGVTNSFSREIIMAAGGNEYLLLLFGIFTAIILGLPLTITAVYIFMALLLAPALIKAGFLPIAVHFFVFWYSALGAITPPVCIPAFAAAQIAEAPLMRTGFRAMAMGSILFLLPIYFIYNPALLLQTSSAAEISLSLLTMMICVMFLASGFGGHMLLIGQLRRTARVSLVLAGILIMAPILTIQLVGGCLGLIVIMMSIIRRLKLRSSSMVNNRM